MNSKDKPEDTHDESQHCDDEVHIVNDKIVTSGMGEPDVNISTKTTQNGDKPPRKKWKTLTSSGQRVVGVTRGAMTNAESKEVPKDDPYPITLKKCGKLSPFLTTVDEEPFANNNLGNDEEKHQDKTFVKTVLMRTSMTTVRTMRLRPCTIICWKKGRKSCLLRCQEYAT